MIESKIDEMAARLRTEDRNVMSQRIAMYLEKRALLLTGTLVTVHTRES